ncbi:hypothetical protein FIBSPDRAFT_962492 [Athelia psychrophila]|uniref:Transmembrane protein n=1 Tax=Athelia psychrophila TaxID=1759441 RepID=A0A166A1W9_9AGAM|nr:hypothetical protein FIBSPDRAFT_962492 [Fibularhizoctonia sp. CBS 109695]
MATSASSSPISSLPPTSGLPPTLPSQISTGSTLTYTSGNTLGLPVTLHSRLSSGWTLTNTSANTSLKGTASKEEAPKEEVLKTNIVPRRKIIAWYIFSLFLVLLCTMLGTFLGWTYRVHDFATSTDTSLSDPNYTGRTISLEADLISVDPVAGVIIIDWYILNDNTCSSPAGVSSDCSYTGIYFESNPLQITTTLDSAGAPITPTNKAPGLASPVFDYFPNVTTNARSSISVWRTSISMLDRHSSGPSTNGYSVSTSLQSYPYDVYFVNVSFFAIEPDALIVPVRLVVANAEGIAVGFKVMALSNTVNSTNGETVQISLQVSRGVLVKTYAIIIVTAVWVVTLLFVCSTAGSLVFGIPQKPEVLAIPVATLFAVTQLRSSMPGAPSGFGAIVDYVGLLPCLAIISACVALSVGVLVFGGDPGDHRKTDMDPLFKPKDHSRQGHSENASPS